MVGRAQREVRVTFYDWFVIAVIAITWPLIIVLGVLAWVMIVRLVIDMFRNGL